MVAGESTPNLSLSANGMKLVTQGKVRSCRGLCRSFGVALEMGNYACQVVKMIREFLAHFFVSRNALWSCQTKPPLLVASQLERLFAARLCIASHKLYRRSGDCRSRSLSRTAVLCWRNLLWLLPTKCLSTCHGWGRIGRPLSRRVQSKASDRQARGYWQSLG